MGKHDERVAFRAPDSLRERLKTEADDRGVSLSKYVRYIVCDHLDFDLVEREKQRIEELYSDLESDLDSPEDEVRGPSKSDDDSGDEDPADLTSGYSTGAAVTNDSDDPLSADNDDGGTGSQEDPFDAN